MKIIKIDKETANLVAPLVADFRVTLREYKNIVSQADIDSGKEEIIDFLNSGYPVFAAEDDGVLQGYIVCRIEEPCLWVEHIYVSKEHRRKGIATLLFNKAEELAASMGEDTVFNYVHPNNENAICFLRSKGYTVLNMIEIRKPYKGERLTTTIKVDKNVFDY
ncbi:MAG: GNAT family N-acetyltransferase [Saccharofermentanales bacterium]|jgi:ribosomal protein S18 acetylase RimI-like enzyme